ncbi:unnamed protein product [Paramecium primaurelia]|uniref:Protein kinase domain containing protein n=1 Tax=Paramecium primaurelia TaxID=5886 RepID=A0A8S1M3M8_PARPR|nr:unnamed protein product [Paramecium primaurelia]
MLSKQQKLHEILSQSILKTSTTKASQKLSQSFNTNGLIGQSLSPNQKTNQSMGQKKTNNTIQYQKELLKLMTNNKQQSSGNKKANMSDMMSQKKESKRINSGISQPQKSQTSNKLSFVNTDITIIVNHENQQIKFNIESSKTTGWLEEYLKQEMKKYSIHQYSSTGSQPDERKVNCGTGNESSDLDIVSFHTVDKNLPIDYYLQQPNKSLEIFSGQTLNLQPFYGTSQQSKITLKDFIFVKCIGVGGFSRVYMVKKKSNGRFYAMKLIDKEFIIQNKKQGIVQNERDIMTVLDHPFIIKLEYAFESKNFIVFVLEFCSGGELFQQLRQVKRMTEDQARFYFTEICLAMFYLHSLSVVYRDIKPENILIDLDGHIRIADFGLSKPNMTEEDYAYSFCGSPEYMAPEMLLKVGHNVQVDHYCLGALLYELVTGLPPYYSRDTDEIYESILNEELTFPEKLNLSSDIKNLLQGLLCKQPSERLGANKGLTELLTHSWFKDVDLIAILQKLVPPPFKPNQLKFNYDQNDLMKGELETREKLLGKSGLKQEIRIFKAFYFDSNEQLQMKQEQAKILKQHFMMITQQQLALNTKFKPQKKSNELKEHQSKKASPQTRNNKQSKLTSEQFQSLQKRIKSQQSSITNVQQVSSVTSPAQSKGYGLNRINSQNNFFPDRQNTLPNGQKELDYNQLLSNVSTEQMLHMRGSSLKQRKK